MHVIFVGGRQAPDIVNWLKKKTGPPCVTIDTVDAAKAMIEKDEVVVIGFFKVKWWCIYLQSYCNTGHQFLDKTQYPKHGDNKLSYNFFQEYKMVYYFLVKWMTHFNDKVVRYN